METVYVISCRVFIEGILYTDHLDNDVHGNHEGEQSVQVQYCSS